MGNVFDCDSERKKQQKVAIQIISRDRVLRERIPKLRELKKKNLFSYLVILHNMHVVTQNAHTPNDLVLKLSYSQRPNFVPSVFLKHFNHLRELKT